MRMTASRRAQGLPDHIEDPDVLAKVARILVSALAPRPRATVPPMAPHPRPPAQRVQVKLRPTGKTLTYAWHGADPLTEGDRVAVPAPSFMPDTHPWEGVVVATTSDYDGALVAVLRRL
jgi:hypothetical protein